MKAANRLSAPAPPKRQPGCLIIGYPGRIKGIFG
uniref:Uncharacterized protein n=1 Tax=Neisseria meningitidis alpha275 TaxID=295996 RepID=C6SMT9_NEIME|nr:hypothetical protein predicted by Glimmer/Critica [Neisseria meningitidis alpha275]